MKKVSRKTTSRMVSTACEYSIELGVVYTRAEADKCKYTVARACRVAADSGKGT